ncbi:MAG: hypothetical protein O7H41_20180 [Planctomycetota bacterium]|nr:hypothetical protein [Planctomycetota bacterium]
MRVMTLPVQPLTLIAIITMTAGCQTVGHYFAKRGRDLADCFTVEAGVGYGLGAELKLAGLIHVAGGGCAYWATPVGLRYGDLVASSEGENWDTGFVGSPLTNLAWIPFHHVDRIRLYLHYSGDTKEDHACYWLLPGLASYSSEEFEPWIWTDPKSGWSRLHAFDIEAHVFLGLVGVRVGFSPGEFLDFLLGWIGIDLAEDDVRVPVSWILDDPNAPPGIWREAAERAAATKDLDALPSLIAGMSRPPRERAALEAIVSLGDAAVLGLANILISPRTNPAPRAACKKALETLLEGGVLSYRSTERARAALSAGE